MLKKEQIADQMPDQETAQRYPNRYRPGQSGNPAGRPSRTQRRALLLGRATELAEPLGGLENLNAIERTLIEHAAELTLSRPRRHDERVATANIVNRILRDVLRRHAPVGNGGSDLGSLLGAARAR